MTQNAFDLFNIRKDKGLTIVTSPKTAIGGDPLNCSSGTTKSLTLGVTACILGSQEREATSTLSPDMRIFDYD